MGKQTHELGRDGERKKAGPAMFRSNPGIAKSAGGVKEDQRVAAAHVSRVRGRRKLVFNPKCDCNASSVNGHSFLVDVSIDADMGFGNGISSAALKL